MECNKAGPLISVVVPVYNVEKYIHRCLDSIICQTYKRLEIILVDDGSPDNSPMICDDYSEIDKRIVVIHKTNGGLASARNAGVAKATGDYICFVDSDDWIASDTLEYCVNLINNETESVDVVQYGIVFAEAERCKLKQTREKITRCTGKEILNYLMIMSTKTDSYFSVCRCLFSADLLKTECFPEGRINEDIAYKYRVLSKAKLMIDSNLAKYFYFQDTGSITTEGFQKRDMDLYIAAEELRKLTAAENYGRIKELGEVKYARTSLSLLCKIAYFGVKDSSINKEETVRTLQAELRSNFACIIRSPMPLSRKCCAILLAINYNILEKALVFLKIIRGN